MRRLKKYLLILLLLFPFIYSGLRITVMNPAWMMGVKYPSAKLYQYSVNSPDIRFWPMVSRLFGIPMIDWDHALNVTIDNHQIPISLDDFIGADELLVKNSKIGDISAFWKPETRLYKVRFQDCDLTSMPPDQRAHLKQGNTPGSYFIPYDDETRKMRIEYQRKTLKR